MMFLQICSGILKFLTTKYISFHQWFSTWSDPASKDIFVSGDSSLSPMRGRVLLASSWEEARKLLNPLRCTGQPLLKNYPAPVAIVSMLGNWFRPPGTGSLNQDSPLAQGCSVITNFFPSEPLSKLHENPQFFSHTFFQTLFVQRKKLSKALSTV